MSFSTEIKNEVCSLKLSRVENISFLSGFVRNNKLENVNKISLLTENPKIVRYLYNLFKEIYGVSPLIEKGKSNNFNKNVYYNLVIDNNANFILKDIMVIDDDNKLLEEPKSYIIDTEDLKRAYLRGVFLACGSINDPKKLGYHMEFFIYNKSEASFVSNILNDFYINNKILARDNNYMVYVKESEKIGDFLRIISANVALLYFEDIRIYRDHKNMTNRLNNCEQANVDKIVSSAQNQLNDIKKLEDVIGFDLLDEKLQEVIVYRKKYPDVSLNDLSIIMTEETGKTITKSGLNHRFRKIQEMAKKLDDK